MIFTMSSGIVSRENPPFLQGGTIGPGLFFVRDAGCPDLKSGNGTAAMDQGARFPWLQADAW